MRNVRTAAPRRGSRVAVTRSRARSSTFGGGDAPRSHKRTPPARGPPILVARLYALGGRIADVCGAPPHRHEADPARLGASCSKCVGVRCPPPWGGAMSHRSPRVSGGATDACPHPGHPHRHRAGVKPVAVGGQRRRDRGEVGAVHDPDRPRHEHRNRLQQLPAVPRGRRDHGLPPRGRQLQPGRDVPPEQADRLRRGNGRDQGRRRLQLRHGRRHHGRLERRAGHWHRRLRGPARGRDRRRDQRRRGTHRPRRSLLRLADVPRRHRSRLGGALAPPSLTPRLARASGHPARSETGRRPRAIMQPSRGPRPPSLEGS